MKRQLTVEHASYNPGFSSGPKCQSLWHSAAKTTLQVAQCHQTADAFQLTIVDIVGLANSKVTTGKSILLSDLNSIIGYLIYFYQLLLATI